MYRPSGSWRANEAVNNDADHVPRSTTGHTYASCDIFSHACVYDGNISTNPEASSSTSEPYSQDAACENGHSYGDLYVRGHGSVHRGNEVGDGFYTMTESSAKDLMVMTSWALADSNDHDMVDLHRDLNGDCNFETLNALYEQERRERHKNQDSAQSDDEDNHLDSIQMRTEIQLDMLRTSLRQDLSRNPSALVDKVCIINPPTDIEVLKALLAEQLIITTGLFAAELCDPNSSIIEPGHRPLAVILCDPRLCNPRYVKSRSQMIQHRDVPDTLLDFAMDGGTLILAPRHPNSPVRNPLERTPAINDFLINDAAVPGPWTFSELANRRPNGEQLRLNRKIARSDNVDETAIEGMAHDSMWLTNVDMDYLLFVSDYAGPPGSHIQSSGPFVLAPYGKGYLGWFGHPFDEKRVLGILLPMLGIW
ncbi:hypothetical protein LTR05_002826 [Lithohypha guttulata]|uniref:Uncharacterized protein n=1 Tax=Lithohypha guttulata TaxID=1690604 RepID=A0AAN7YID0_9EURO|nr:hypothetical protein LTR05_002826 [Lithohypha guttulata]